MRSCEHVRCACPARDAPGGTLVIQNIRFGRNGSSANSVTPSNPRASLNNETNSVTRELHALLLDREILRRVNMTVVCADQELSYRHGLQ